MNKGSVLWKKITVAMVKCGNRFVSYSILPVCCGKNRSAVGQIKKLLYKCNIISSRSMNNKQLSEIFTSSNQMML